MPVSGWHWRAARRSGHEARHRSRLSGVIIDCRTKDLVGAVAFRSKALGYPTRPCDDPEVQGWVSLETARHIEVQKVDHPSRVQIDIGSDDPEANREAPQINRPRRHDPPPAGRSRDGNGVAKREGTVG